MNNDKTLDLDGQIKNKAQQLDERKALLERYAQNCGRDRWYNRGCHDITTLEEELRDLQSQQASSEQI